MLVTIWWLFLIDSLLRLLLRQSLQLVKLLMGLLVLLLVFHFLLNFWLRLSWLRNIELLMPWCGRELPHPPFHFLARNFLFLFRKVIFYRILLLWYLLVLIVLRIMCIFRILVIAIGIQTLIIDNWEGIRKIFVIYEKISILKLFRIIIKIVIESGPFIGSLLFFIVIPLGLVINLNILQLPISVVWFLPKRRSIDFVLGQILIATRITSFWLQCARNVLGNYR